MPAISKKKDDNKEAKYVTLNDIDQENNKGEAYAFFLFVEKNKRPPTVEEWE